MAKSQLAKPSFEQFLSSFPPVDLPFSLGEDTHHLFSKENDPIPGVVIAEYILPLEGGEEDDVTEYIACFSLPTPKNYHATVYWKAGLLNYLYKLVTWDTKGNVIDQKVIAGTTYDGTDLTQTMAAIQEDLMLYLVSGQSSAEIQRAADVADDYTAANSTANRFQLTEEGKIVEL